MKRLDSQTGASHLVAILAVVVIAAVGIVGYRVVSSKTADETASSTKSSASSSTEIKSKADVVQADKQLDQTTMDDVDPAQLDSDLNSIL